MTERPHVLLSVAASIDGYIDDTSDQRLLLSNDEDFDRVDDVRASVDAILVGAGTIRADNPRLLIRSPHRQQQRTDNGRTPHPVKVAVTSTGDLDPAAKFFTTGDTDKIIYTTGRALPEATERLGHTATVTATGEDIDFPAIFADLHRRGVKRLMVEGGATIHTHLLSHGLFDELHLVIAPFLIGNPKAPHFASTAHYRHGPTTPLTLTSTRQIGDVVLLQYHNNRPDQ